MNFEKNFSDINSWPFQEARKLIERIEKQSINKEIVFETGYGPSGLPHIGTFCEVYRTTLVQQALKLITGKSSKLICFSDDMDGFRKVPDNVPNKEKLFNYLGHPLSKVPDPFQTHNSFGEHNNFKLKKFLDSFDFDYEFYSATECYKSGRFDNSLNLVLQNFEEIRNIILPTLGEERKKTYSPFLPICPETNKVLEVKINEIDKQKGEILYTDPRNGKEVSISIFGGFCKLQWKCDWAMRWLALGIDYEMAGKDLIESVNLSGKIIRKLGGLPPEGFNYELFLDESGEKISKSKGNGLTIEEWLKYGPKESLAHFMYNNPKRAKRLYFDVIPKSVDEYINNLNKFDSQDKKEQFQNSVLYVHNTNHENVPKESSPLSYSLILNLVSVCHAEDPRMVWGYIEEYSPGVSSNNNAFLDGLVKNALIYYNDRVKPFKTFRKPNNLEKQALQDLIIKLESLDKDTLAEDIQTEIFSVGKKHNYENLREWFKALYEVVLGQTEGPRMGSFIKLYGIKKSIDLIKSSF